MYFPRLWALASHHRAHTLALRWCGIRYMFWMPRPFLGSWGVRMGSWGCPWPAAQGVPCVWGRQGYRLFFILVLTQCGIWDTFLLLDDDGRYLIPLVHSPSWERCQLPRTACGACRRMGPLLPWCLQSDPVSASPQFNHRPLPLHPCSSLFPAFSPCLSPFWTLQLGCNLHRLCDCSVAKLCPTLSDFAFSSPSPSGMERLLREATRNFQNWVTCPMTLPRRSLVKFQGQDIKSCLGYKWSVIKIPLWNPEEGTLLKTLIARPGAAAACPCGSMSQLSLGEPQEKSWTCNSGCVVQTAGVRLTLRQAAHFWRGPGTRDRPQE